MSKDRFTGTAAKLYEGLLQPTGISAEETLADARALAEAAARDGNESEEALGLIWQALLGFMMDTDAAELDATLQRCVTVAQDAGEYYLLGRAYNVLALEALARGQYLLAYNYLNLVLDCSQRLEGREGVHLESLASGNLGATYFYLGDYKKSLDLDLRALSLREALNADHDASALASYIVDVGLNYVGIGDLEKAQQCFDTLTSSWDCENEGELSADDLYFAYELGMYLYDALGDTARRDEQISKLIDAAARLTDLVADFNSICRDIDFLVARGLLEEARRLIDASQAFIETTSRPYVRTQFLHSQLACANAMGDSAKAVDLAVQFCEQNERVLSYEKVQTLDAFTMLDKVRLARSENERLSYQSRHDELTHLRNRQALRDDFPKLYGEQVWAVVIDVDHFKEFNDTMGHRAGDSALCNVAGAIQASFPEGKCYRTGGDEFLVLMADEDEAGVIASIEHCQRAIPDVTGTLLGDAQIAADRSVGVSVGYASARCEGAGDLRKLLDKADQLLFAAKRAGRGSVRGATL